MSNVHIYRGGTPILKCLMCREDYGEWGGPFNTPLMPATPPYNSHADAAHGQGYLNLHFPLVPRLADTTAHMWMSKALRSLSAVGDVIFTNWVPHRSIVTDMHWEVVKTDDMLDGVYIKPVAYRAVWDFDAEEPVYTDIADYATVVSNAGVDQFPLGTAGSSDSLWGYAHNDNPKCTFGHDIPKFENGKPVDGLDDYFGTVLLGFEVSAGDADKIALIHKSNIAVYSSYKLLSFEGAAQV